MAKLNLRDALNTSLARTKLYIDTELAKKADSSHGTHLTLGTGSGNAFRGDYGNTAYQHSQAAHAPSNAQKNSDITKAEIEAKLTGAITSHTHSYLPLSGGTMTGAITTPNNAQGIKVGDDAVICDRNIANHIVIEGATATNGGITFGSNKDTNIYRDGPNLLKTDDKFNAVGGLQWNGQSLDNRYAASSHGTHLTIGTGSGNAAAGNHTHEFNHLIDINISNYTSIDSNSLEPTRGMKFFSNIKGNTEGMFPSERDDNCILSINRGVGNGYVTHLGFGYDGLYYRKANGTLFSNTHQWYKIYSTENKPTLADIGAAPTSHASTATTYGAASASNYGHAMASSTTPKANGTAAVGSETAKFARGDHVHPLQTTVSGNAGTATKLATARTLTIGNTGKSFDGSGNVSWSLSEIGAAPASHGTHLTIGTGASNAAAGNHTHNYAGSSSAGGAANNSEKFGGYSLWVGTQAQYDAISSKSSTTIYIIK